MDDLEKKIRAHLVSTPRPAKIVVKTEADEVHEFGPAKGGMTWSGIARSILALEPKTIEVYNEAGRIERAMRCDEDEKPAASNEVATPAVLNADPETARLTHFANLLFRATQFATDKAFDKMTELFETVSDMHASTNARLERVEQAYRRSLQDRLDEEFERVKEMKEEAEQQNGATHPLIDMAEAFVQGAAQAKANGANGAKS